MEKELITQDWYKVLVNDCKVIITETRFISRWALIEGYWNLGKRIREDDNIKKLDSDKKYSMELTKLLQGLAGALLDAEARIGEILKANPSRYKVTNRKGSDFLPDGITHNQSSQFQKLADYPDVIEQVIAEAQGFIGALLYAEARIGELLKDYPHRGVSIIGKRGSDKTLPAGITHNQSLRFQKLVDYPDVIEQVIAEAIENDDLPINKKLIKLLQDLGVKILCKVLQNC